MFSCRSALLVCVCVCVCVFCSLAAAVAHSIPESVRSTLHANSSLLFSTVTYLSRCGKGSWESKGQEIDNTDGRKPEKVKQKSGRCTTTFKSNLWCLPIEVFWIATADSVCIVHYAGGLQMSRSDTAQKCAGVYSCHLLQLTWRS